MEAVHSILGYLTGAGVIAGMAWSYLRMVREQPDRRWFDWLGLAVAGVVVVEVATGAIRQTSGGQPQAAHALLAGVSVVAIPLIRTASGYFGGFGARDGLVWLVTYAVVGLSLIGLFVTG